ncbi:fumble-domain-containing protein [Eremomyces bilateralis CBS 781.70]|uniref:Fumble-domain-containing protein n=1 Tax=Eremomyces bilateralis CBS 781.70 TaxID=1392243 RepID=A0A6G1G4R5_9PEZI|nr:fumble-domain-containing protein [Eremomyces bilateralis CBS 781.70]KAF1812992.1 fumble-domain-containing protein [Eremomyces bilateralis CBS 781.70]
MTPREDSAIADDDVPTGKAPAKLTVIGHPGTVRINVQGAFIVDDEPTTPNGTVLNDLDRDHLDRDHLDSSHHTKDIRLPNHRAVVSHMAIDIGGSLAKLVYFVPESSSSPELGGRLSFMKVETERIDSCIEFMRRLRRAHEASNGGTPGDLCVMATGGGAFKYYEEIKEALGIEVLREEEMECLIIGLDFFINEIPNEVFTYSEDDPMHFVESREPIYPYLLVNIGSGVSMVKVSGPRQFQRVGGTAMGGGTLWGLLSLLTGARNFDEMLRMSDHGDNTAVDMLVGDIYGTDYLKIGLKSTTIASSFGKVYKMKRQAEREAEDHGGLSNGDRFRERDDGDGPVMFRPEDISRSLLYAISNNIGQIAYLHAEKHGLEHIYFGGSFIGGHRQTMHTLSYAVNFWSKGEKQAYFLRHEGYLGAVGAFLKRQPLNWGRRNSTDALHPLSRATSKGQ